MSHQNQEREQFQRPDQRISAQTRAKIVRATRIGLSVGLVILVVFPVYWMFINSLRPHADILQVPQPLIPETFTLNHYAELFNQTAFGAYFRNSIMVAAASMFITAILATLGGYGLARAGFKGKRNLARAVLLTYMFPSILIAIPLYLIFLELNLVNSYIALVLGHVGRSLPFCLWLMWQFFQSIPRSYEESAWIYGASIPRALFQIIFPMALPGIVAVLIFSFTISWNDYTVAVVLMNETARYTIPVGLSLFMGETVIRWGRILAAGVITLTPPLLLIAFLQRYLLLGFGIKY